MDGERISARTRHLGRFQQPMTAAESYATGKEIRRKVPHESQGEWRKRAGREEPLALLRSQEDTRLAELLPLRHERMALSPFAFYRGNAIGMAADLATTPSSGLYVQACGDAHIANFGAFAAPSRRLVFDINDFDETLPAPWEWDVKRLVTSIEICGRDRGFDKNDRNKAVRSCARRYRESMLGFAEKGTLDVWYARLDVEDTIAQLDKMGRLSGKQRRSLEQTMAKAAHRTSEGAVAKLTEVVEGKLRLTSQPPLIVPLRELLPEARAHEVELAVWALLKEYEHSLSDGRRHLMEQYSYVDCGRKVVGIGSVGTRSWIAIFSGRDEGDPLVLQIKEAQHSVLEKYTGISRYPHQGRRVVEGQRLMQAASDILLGWVTSPALDGRLHDFYVRQLWDWKSSPDLETIDADGLRRLGELCAWTLARAHARSGDRFGIAGYLGTSERFDQAMTAFAGAYADQNEFDYSSFMEAREQGSTD